MGVPAACCGLGVPSAGPETAARLRSLTHKHVLGEQELSRSAASLAMGILLCDASRPGWPVVFATTVMGRLACRGPHELVGKTLADLFEPTGAPWPVLPTSLPALEAVMCAAHR